MHIAHIAAYDIYTPILNLSRFISLVLNDVSCYCPKYHSDCHNCDHLWQLKAVTMRLVQKSFKNLVLPVFFVETFCDGKLLCYKNGHNVIVTNVTNCDRLTAVVTLLKAVTIKMVIESFKSPCSVCFFVTICNLIHFYILH
jgi:hypothetical protein